MWYIIWNESVGNGKSYEKKTYFYENLPFYIIDSNLFKKHNTKTVNENVLVL